MISISILIMSQINAANSLHNKNILETTTIIRHVSQAAILHFTHPISKSKQIP